MNSGQGAIVNLYKCGFSDSDGKERQCAVSFLPINKVNLVEILYQLHPLELLRMESYAVEKRRHSYGCGRVCAKEALRAIASSLYASNLYIENGLLGQPVVKSDKKDYWSNLKITISHSPNYAVALAFPEEYLMGIDVEEVDYENSTAVFKFLTSYEIQMCLRLSEFDIDQVALLLWSAKECIAKILGTGFTIPISFFEVKEIENNGNNFTIYFKNFSQFIASSILLPEAEMVVSVGYPEKLKSFPTVLNDSFFSRLTVAMGN